MWDFSVNLVATYGCTNSTWDIQDNNLSSRSLAKTEQANDRQAPNQELKDLLALICMQNMHGGGGVQKGIVLSYMTHIGGLVEN